MVEVARALNRMTGVQTLYLLQRRGGGPQKGLQFQARRENIGGTISLRRNNGQLPRQVVLIDDIFTSGATADECTRVLRGGGVGKVHVLTLAAEL
jgi:predicted amidophosphoribosyltransferase